jgi:hypothetical protein
VSTGQRRIYFDGALAGTKTATGNYQGSGAMVIGTSAWQPATESFDGNLDDVRVLTAAQVLALVNGVP